MNLCKLKYSFDLFGYFSWKFKLQNILEKFFRKTAESCYPGSRAIVFSLPTQIRFLLGGERVTCHGSKLSNALGRTKLSNSLGQQNLNSKVDKRIQFALFFELGGITKHLMTGPKGNFPLESVIKCLLLSAYCWTYFAFFTRYLPLGNRKNYFSSVRKSVWALNFAEKTTKSKFLRQLRQDLPNRFTEMNLFSVPGILISFEKQLKIVRDGLGN